MLFLLVVEILAINIKTNKDIHGINVNEKEIFISQLADDTTLFINDEKSLENVFIVLDKFHKCAGLKLNKNKTGSRNIDLSKYDIRTPDTIKYLGISISKQLNDIEILNYKEKIVQIKNKLNMWKSRKLSIKGKITILRSQIIPIILYTAAVLYTPQNIMEEIDSLFFSFIWPYKKHHVKKKVLVQRIECGGLKMPDIASMIKACKLTWIKRLLTKENNFTHFAKLNCNIQDFSKYFSHMSRTFIDPNPSIFYSQILDYWDELRETNLSKMNVNDILNEKLCYNKNILFDNKPFTSTKLTSERLKIIFDLLKPDLSFKRPSKLHTLTIMEYNQLISAIPREWKSIIKSTKHNYQFKRKDDFNIRVGITEKHILKIKCKDFYWHLVNKTYIAPTATIKWEELYYYINFNWKNIFMLPYHTTSETSLQSLQYKIINRYFPCKSFTSMWNQEHDDECTVCHTTEDLEHYFFNCVFVQSFWQHLFSWFYALTKCKFNLKAIDIILGVMNETNDNLLNVLNYCILFAKGYIAKCKENNIDCSFDIFLCKLKDRLLIEEYISHINCKSNEFASKWNIIMKELS